jgi:hypothetical protein
MKSNAPSSLYFSMFAVKPVNAGTVNKSPYNSPYLRAILSGKNTLGTPAILRMLNADRLAALRYIKESAKRLKK